MTRYLLIMLLVVSRGWAETNVLPPAAAPAPATNEVTEVIDALRAHYVDRDRLDDKSLRAASLAGILNAIGQGAVLLTPSANGTNAAGVIEAVGATPAGVAPVARAEVIQPDIGYLHVVRVSDASANAVDAELKKFVGAKVSGYVLDLRNADGEDYAAAAALAGRFLADGQELFHIKRAGKEDEVFHAGAGAPVRVAEAPLMLLVNARTHGSAEALVGALRAQGRGIVIGSLTAGSAVAWDDVPLQDGRVLRVATAKVVLRPAEAQSKAVTEVFPGGIPPDIFVAIDAAVERDVLSDVATNVTLTVSLQPTTGKKRRSEAELVKAFRGEPIELSLPKPTTENGGKEGEAESEIQPVRDVVLQRAVDILKGIRVLLSWK